MKKILVLLIFLLGFINSIEAKSYRILNADIKVYIKKNGVIHIEETRTYYFKGSYKWANFELAKRGYDQVSNFRVWEGDEVYLENDSEDPGTFEIKEKKSIFDIKWYYRAKNEERTFTVCYDLYGAIVSDSEWSEFYWTFLARGWDRANENIHVDVLFEEPTSLAFWADGYQPVFLNKMDYGWQLDASDMRKRDEIRVKTHFKTAYLNQASSIKGEISPDIADQIHENYLRELIQKEERNKVYAYYGNYLFVLVIALSIVAFFHFYNKNKPIYEDTKTDSYLSIHPALLVYLMNYRTIAPNAMKASLMKLIFEGFIELHVVGKEKKKWTSERPLIEVKKTNRTIDELTYEFEKDLYSFIIERAEKYTYFDDIFKKEQTKTSKWYMNWSNKLVKNEAKKIDWYIKETRADIIGNIVSQFFLTLLGGFVVFALGPIGIFALLTPLIFGVISGTILHRNQVGESLYNTLKEKKKNITLLRKNKVQIPEDANWTLMIIALTLGNSKDDVKYILESLGMDSIPNIILSKEFSDAGFLFLIDDVLNVTHGAYLGSSAGGAVGASAGAAGGGGGGGAG